MLLALLALASPAHAASLTVDPSDATAYSSVQDAIDASTSGDTIAIVAGTFSECIDTSGKSLTLRGTGASATTIDGASSCTSAVTITRGEFVTLEDLAIDNAYYRAILVEASTVTLDTVRLEGLGYSDYVAGAGIHADAAIVTVTDSTFSTNQGSYGGAIHATNASRVSVSDSTFEGNYARYYGGAVWVDNASTFDSEENGYVDNYSYFYGGAVYGSGTGTLLTSNADEYDGNWGYYTHGSAIYVQDDAILDVAEAAFSNHYSYYWTSGYNGTIYATGANTVLLEDLTFTDNRGYAGGDITLLSGDATIDGIDSSGAYAYYGGSMYIASTVTATISNLVIEQGEAVYSGGAIYATSSVDLTLTSAVFTDNTASNSYGGDLYQSSSGSLTIDGLSSDGAYAYRSGGSIYLEQLSGLASLTNATITSSEAAYGAGGAIYAYNGTDVALTDSRVSNATAYNSGGAVYSHYLGALSIESTELSNNTSTYGYGGGLYFYPYTEGTYDLTVTGSSIEDNRAYYDGGGLYAQATGALVVHDTRLVTNDANTSTGTSQGGGAFFSSTNSLSFTNNHVCSNTAYDGGGVFSYSVYGGRGDDEWSNNVFQENAANYSGGALHIDRHYHNELVNNTFVGNLAGFYGGTIYGYYLYTDFLNNIVAYTPLSDGMYGDYYTDYYSNLEYNNWYNNTSSDFDGALSTASLGAGNLFDDPLFRDYTNDGNCDNDDLRIDPSSTLVDAGDPAFIDTDGSTSDIGAYGGVGSSVFDSDGDGYDNVDDCDDSDSAVYPGATEACNGYDDDCDGDIDESGSTGESTWYADSDSDGYGDPATSLDACDQPSGYVVDSTDCDDTASSVYPGATETWYDGVDADCAGDSDFDADAD
ncbi:MAG: hypothetical protein CL927_09730, partial [Deltaproteobacteria bacterium]|nr:hypothetical protein [Deltaproteobacteria bacterium]